MTLTLKLPRNLEQRLTTEAARLGLPVERYALRLLASKAESQGRKKTGEDLVSYWRDEGVIGSRTDIVDSQAYAREIRKKAEHRSRR